jgi:phosphoglycerol transferase MdoB-like AlkP superfamily enzyme
VNRVVNDAQQLAGATNTTLITLAVHHGIGRHIMYLTPYQIKEAIKFELLAQPWGIISPTLSRVSFALFLLKFAGQRKWIRWSLWSVIWIQVVANLATIIQIFAQCQHYASLWDPSVGGHCISPHVQVLFGYAQGGKIFADPSQGVGFDAHYAIV